MSYFVLDYLAYRQLAYAHLMTAYDYTSPICTMGFGVYRAKESETSGLMEIGYVIKNPLIIENHTLGETYTAEEGDIFIFPPGHELSVRTMHPGEHKHITTEHMIDATVEVHPGEELVQSGFGRKLALPYLIPAQAPARQAKNRVCKITTDYTLLAAKSFFEQSADFCTLLDDVRRASDPGELARSYISPKYRLNCRKAEEYIENHMDQRIRIQDIADEIGLSKNYLINIFSQYKGMGLTEYIHRVKLNHVILLITRYGYSIKRACEYVGYEDVNYVSRIFPKYYGVSIREYCRMTFRLNGVEGQIED